MSVACISCSLSSSAVNLPIYVDESSCKHPMFSVNLHHIIIQTRFYLVSTILHPQLPANSSINSFVQGQTISDMLQKCVERHSTSDMHFNSKVCMLQDRCRL